MAEFLKEVDLMRRGQEEGALDLDAINRDGHDAADAAQAIIAAAKQLTTVVAEYCRDGQGVAIVNNDGEMQIIGVARVDGTPFARGAQ